jgi:type I restriction enzyme S subunit
MALTKFKLGDLIEIVDERNSEKLFGENSVVGLGTQKEIIKTKADLDGVNLSSHKLFPPKAFAYVPDTSRRGDKMSLAYNNEEKIFLVSSISVVFRISRKDILMSDYLFMFFNRPEFDRYARFNSWGSARETFSWSEMCNMEIKLPPLEIQKKFVAVYDSMVANQKSYESGLEDLKLVCDGYIEELRRKFPCEKIGNYIERCNERNFDGKLKKVMGLSTKKDFREAQSRVNRNELKNYKIVNPLEFTFVPTTDTWKVLAFAFNKFDEKIVVSPIYEVFSVNQSELLSAYLAIWLSRSEFDRYARFNSWGSARENFSFADMCQVEIPIPDIKIQKSIVEIYEVLQTRKKILEQLKNQIKQICPILIKGSLDEGEMC